MQLKRHISGTFGTNVLLIVVGIGSSIFINRVLGPAGKGEYAIFLAAIGLSTLVLSFGTHSAVSYYVAKATFPIQKLLSTILFFLLVVSVIFFVLVCANGYWNDNEFFLPKRQNHLFYWGVLSLSFVCSLLSTFFISILSGKRLFHIVNLHRIIQGVLNLLAFSALYYACFEGEYLDSGMVFVLYLLLSLISLAVLLFFYFRQVGLGFGFSFLSLPQIWTVFRWSGISYFAVLAQFLNYRIDYWLIDYYAGNAPLGYYSLATNLAQMFWLLPVAVSSVLMPHTASAAQGEMLPKTLLISRAVFAISLLAALPAALLAGPVIELLYSQAFLPSAEIFVILLVGVVPFCLTKIYAGFLAGEGIHRYNMIASLAGLAVTIVLDLLLIPTYGTTGAAWATSMSFLMTTAYVLYVICRRYGIRPGDTLLVKKSDYLFAKNLIQNFISNIKHKNTQEDSLQ